MQKSTRPTVLGDQDGILDEAATSARAGRLAARLAGSDLDAQSLELITAALMAEICDSPTPRG
ncbi:MAG TPA: hypothetical protein VGR20_10925 [Acidimicrobiia bacterium]|jgi:hypothetical protein|nr:hypothetical protein [Acidimicrobiia bacterium]